jgi:hypothetical protein
MCIRIRLLKWNDLSEAGSQSLPIKLNHTWNLLVGGFKHVLFLHIFGIIIPTDGLIFFKMVIAPPSSLDFHGFPEFYGDSIWWIQSNFQLFWNWFWDSIIESPWWKITGIARIDFLNFHQGCNSSFFHGSIQSIRAWITIHSLLTHY